jgi:hypothetical protein
MLYHGSRRLVSRQAEPCLKVVSRHAVAWIKAVSRHSVPCLKAVSQKAVPWFRHKVVNLSLQRPWFNLRTVQVGFLAYKATMDHVSLRLPPLPLSVSIHQRSTLIVLTNDIVK